jgi:ferric-dicitrate binding protein FerR (iron transport regulator)
MAEARIIELLTRKLAGEASEDELQELKELIARYPETIYTEEAFRQIWNSKAVDEDTDPFYARHRRKHREEFDSFNHVEPIHTTAHPKPRNRLILSSFFALFVVAAAVYFFFLLPGRQAKPSGYTRIVSGKGVRKSVKLPDGTNVWLNSDSRLSFEAGMNEKNERIVELEGEAFFDVVHITGRPFIIHTNKVLIRVIGTAFNVKAYPNDKKSETTLIRGMIELSTVEGPKQKFILKPSEKFSLIQAKTGGKGRFNGGKEKDSSTLLIELVESVRLANKEYVPETSWTENKLIFENETLEDLAPKLERWFDVKINVVRKNPAGERFTGSFANETIEQALTAMKLIKPFNFTINEKNITIY